MIRAVIPSIAIVVGAACAVAALCPQVATRFVAGVSAHASKEGMAAVQMSPAFRSADLAFRQRRYPAALANLESLADRSGWSKDQTDYLRNQISLCRSAMPNGATPGSAATLAAPDSAARTSPARFAPNASLKPNITRYADCGPKALALVCRDLGVKADAAAIGRMAGENASGVSMAGLAKAAEKLGLKARGVLVSRQAMGDLKLPAVAWWMRRHFVEVTAIGGDEQTGSATIHDPSEAKERTIPREQLLEASGGYFLLVERP